MQKHQGLNSIKTLIRPGKGSSGSRSYSSQMPTTQTLILSSRLAGRRSIRHYFTLDKKWPVENRQMAFSLAAGFVWESKRKYTGELAAGREKDDFQFILRPNIEF